LPLEEVRMTTAPFLKVAHRVEDGVEVVGDQVKGVDHRAKVVDDKVRSLVTNSTWLLRMAKKRKLRCDRRQTMSTEEKLSELWTGGPPDVAVFPGPLHESKYRVRRSTRRVGNVVLPRK